MKKTDLESQLKENGFSSSAGIWFEYKKDTPPLRKWHIHGNRATYYNRQGFQQNADWVEIRTISLESQ